MDILKIFKKKRSKKLVSSLLNFEKGIRNDKNIIFYQNQLIEDGQTKAVQKNIWKVGHKQA